MDGGFRPYVSSRSGRGQRLETVLQVVANVRTQGPSFAKAVGTTEVLGSTEMGLVSPSHSE